MRDARQWAWGRQAVDVITEYPVRATAAEWTSALKLLQPRLYSISSSPLAGPGRIRLVVSVVRYENRHGRPMPGARVLLGEWVVCPVEETTLVMPHMRERAPSVDALISLVECAPRVGAVRAKETAS